MNRGFTVIELLLSVAIIAVISAIGISAMSPVNTDKALITETEKYASTYSVGAAGNQMQTLHDEVKISALALTGGGFEIVFSKLTGATTQSGTVTLTTLRDAGTTKVITITSTGAAYSN
ncbi:MAG: hypothetical protein UY50_C0002G0002 [Parcubacteria group bacterium GW2011_GWA2_49_9]|nr:MAG: hypothetical protein UY50_C0002G0002 [Parcubacteria group bacterium GW2011_GWA2_49_9]